MSGLYSNLRPNSYNFRLQSFFTLMSNGLLGLCISGLAAQDRSQAANYRVWAETRPAQNVMLSKLPMFAMFVLFVRCNWQAMHSFVPKANKISSRSVWGMRYGMCFAIYAIMHWQWNWHWRDKEDPRTHSSMISRQTLRLHRQPTSFNINFNVVLLHTCRVGQWVTRPMTCSWSVVATNNHFVFTVLYYYWSTDTTRVIPFGFTLNQNNSNRLPTLDNERHKKGETTRPNALSKQLICFH